MRDRNGRRHAGAGRALQGSLQFLAFGLCVLAFLIAIDRPQWFHIRPASGTAAAMAHAATADDGTR